MVLLISMSPVFYGMTSLPRQVWNPQSKWRPWRWKPHISELIQRANPRLRMYRSTKFPWLSVTLYYIMKHIELFHGKENWQTITHVFWCSTFTTSRPELWWRNIWRNGSATIKVQIKLGGKDVLHMSVQGPGGYDEIHELQGDGGKMKTK